MNESSCQSFRLELMAALEGRPRPDELRNLSWHEHLLGCSECRDLLEREEALELLLASLPEPNLPPDLTRRLLERLGEQQQLQEVANGLDSLLDLDGAMVPEGLAQRVRAGLAREVALDQVLDRWEEPTPPADLATRISEGIRTHQEAQLDGLLDLNTVPAAPRGLSQEILDNLEAHRERRVPQLRLLARMPRFAAAAALLLGMLSAPMWIQEPGPVHVNEDVASGEVPTLPGIDDVDPSLLAMLDVLENDEIWSDSGELLFQDEDDLHLLLEEEIDVEDEMLLSYLSEDDPSMLGEGR